MAGCGGATVDVTQLDVAVALSSRIVTPAVWETGLVSRTKHGVHVGLLQEMRSTTASCCGTDGATGARRSTRGGGRCTTRARGASRPGTPLETHRTSALPLDTAPCCGHLPALQAPMHCRTSALKVSGRRVFLVHPPQNRATCMRSTSYGVGGRPGQAPAGNMR